MTGDRGWGTETRGQRQRRRMEMTVGRGARDDYDDCNQARRGDGKEKRRQQEGHHDNHTITTTAPPTAAMSNCSRGGNREQWGMGTTGEGVGMMMTKTMEWGAIRQG